MKYKGVIIRRIIILIWLLGLGFLIRKSYLPNGFISPKTEKTSLIPAHFKDAENREGWMGIYFKGVKIGHTHHQLTKNSQGYTLKDDSFMEISLRGEKKKITTQISAQVDPGYKLLFFDFNLSADMVSLSGRGEVIGKELVLKTYPGGENFTQTKIGLKSEPLLWLNLTPVIISKGLTPLRRYTFTVFDPFILSDSEVTLEVIGKEELIIGTTKIEAMKITTSLRGMTISSWVDEKGEMVKEESPLGFTLLKEPPETARENRNEEIDFLNSFAISSDKELNNLPHHDFLKVKLVADLEDLNLSGGRQSLEGNILSIRKERLPIQGPNSPEDLLKYLQPEMFVQSEAKEIKDQARKIIDGENDPLRKTRLLLSWVYKNISKEFFVSVPNAVEILKIKKGDCNEHATLFAALSRAAGIPTKIVTGIMYLNGKFYYHAWNEVFIGGWITLDSLIDQFPADVSHIRFIEGGIDQQGRLIRVMGRLKMEVLDYQ